MPPPASSIVRVQDEVCLNERRQYGEGYFPHPGAHYPLPRQRDESVIKKVRLFPGRRLFVEYPSHLFGIAFAEPRRMQPKKRPIKNLRHKASFGLAPRKRSFASRTISSKRVISAEKTRRPNAVNR